MFSISYAADEHYCTNDIANGAGRGGTNTAVYENAVQAVGASTLQAPGAVGAAVSTSRRRLTHLNAYNNSASPVFIKVQDSANAGVDGGRFWVYEVFQNDFFDLAVHGGMTMFNGIYVKAFTDAGCTIAAGNVMSWQIDWMAGV